MIDTVAAGISQALAQAFSGCQISRETVRQDLHEPYFLIQTISPACSRQPGGGHRLSYPFVVTYAPKSQETPNAEMEGVGDRLFYVLDTIVADGVKIRGSNLHYEKQDGLLHFYAAYEVTVVPGGTEEEMGEITQRTEMKEETHGRNKETNNRMQELFERKVK